MYDLPPDAWSECLHYLAPEELSRTSRLLPLSTKGSPEPITDQQLHVHMPVAAPAPAPAALPNHDDDDDVPAERAAWMAVGSMVEIAERYWIGAEEQQQQQQQQQQANSSHDSVARDEEGIAVRTLVANDPSLVGRILRNNSNSNSNRGATGASQGGNSSSNSNNSSNRGRKRRQFVRFRDETWQGLYGLLYSILSEVIIEPNSNLSADDDGTANEWEGDSDIEHQNEHGSDDESESDTEYEIEIEGDEDEDEDNDEDNIAIEEEEEEGAGDPPPNAATDPTTNKVYDPEYIALAVGLLLDAPPLPALLLTPQRRKKLEKIASACHSLGRPGGLTTTTNNNNNNNHTHSSTTNTTRTANNDGTHRGDGSYTMKWQWRLSEARSCLVSLRLSNAGLWNIASDILTSRALFDAEDLGDAIRFGRKALELAKARYQAFRAKQTSATTRIEDKGWWTPSDGDGSGDGTGGSTAAAGREPGASAQQQLHLQQQQQQQQQPPPPIRSLFANDALRYMHAQLALMKALALVGQHIGLGACDVNDLGVFPNDFTEEQRQQQQQRPPGVFGMEALMRCIRAASMFFGEGMEQSLSFDEVFGEQWEIVHETDKALALASKTNRMQEPTGKRQSSLMDSDSNSEATTSTTRSELMSLLGAKISALGELKYCLASFRSRIQDERCAQDAFEAVEHMAQAFRVLMQRIFAEQKEKNKEEGSNGGGELGSGSGSLYCCRLDESTIEILVRCAKDLGKVCGFVRSRGIRSNGNGGASEIPPVDSKNFLEFAYVFSIYLHGSSHPTVRNIKRLCGQQQEQQTEFPPDSVETKYNRVVEWLIKEYHNTNRSHQ
eukprot:jgi/Psemu1/290444/fgenesh1_pg.499_\